NLFIIIEKYDDYLKDRITFDEFYKRALLPFLISNRKYKNELEDINTDSLDLLSANVKDRYDVYRNQSDLGNEQEARKERKEAVIIAGKIVEKLEFIRDNAAKKTSTSSMIENHALTSMTTGQNLGLEEKDWIILLDSIKAKKCIPFLG